MANPIQYYVDPAINANSGTGTAIDPYGDLQYCLNTITRNATYGDLINIKAGTAEVLAASLTLATYGTPAYNVPLILRGYTSAAGDGGVAEINCNGAVMLASAYTMQFADLQIHNFGNNNGITVGVFSSFYHCNVHKGASSPSGKNLLQGNTYFLVENCYIHDAGTNGYGLNAGASGMIVSNYIENCPYGINCNNYCSVENNIIVGGTTFGLVLGYLNIIRNNTFYCSTAATGKGIASYGDGNTIENNIFEGYSGSGGIGIWSGADIWRIGYNSFYNCATKNSLTTDVYLDLTANDVTLSASPFTNPGSGDFSLKTTVTGCIENSYPGARYGPASTTNKQDRGAVQNGAGTGGAVTISPSRGGGL